MTFKEKLVILRKSRKLTQDDFAAAVGVSRQAVYKWESGQSYPEVPKLIEMKLLLNISIDDLLDDSYDIPLPEKKRRKRMTKEEKAQIEASVQKNGNVVKAASVVAPKAAPAPVAAPAPAPAAAPAPKKAAPKKAAPKKAAPAPKVEEPVVEAPKTEAAPAPKVEEPVVEAPKTEAAPIEPVVIPQPEITVVETPASEVKEEKKTGFFGKLFGRK